MSTVKDCIKALTEDPAETLKGIIFFTSMVGVIYLATLINYIIGG